MDDCIVASKTQWRDYITPALYTVLLILFWIIARRGLLQTLTNWLVDIIVSAILLYGTYTRVLILNDQSWTTYCDSSYYETAYKYFTVTIYSWLAVIVLELTTSIKLLRTIYTRLIRSLDTQERIKWFLKWLICSFFAANSVAVVFKFSVDVKKTLLTNDMMLIIYYWVVAAIKVTSVFIQGVFFSSCVTSPQPSKPSLEHIQTMNRMTFVSAVGFCHSLGLAYFRMLNSNSEWTLQNKLNVTTLMLLIDLVYQLRRCLWYYTHSQCCLTVWINRMIRYVIKRLAQTMQSVTSHVRQENYSGDKVGEMVLPNSNHPMRWSKNDHPHLSGPATTRNQTRTFYQSSKQEISSEEAGIVVTGLNLVVHKDTVCS